MQGDLGGQTGLKPAEVMGACPGQGRRYARRLPLTTLVNDRGARSGPQHSANQAGVGWQGKEGSRQWLIFRAGRAKANAWDHSPRGFTTSRWKPSYQPSWL